MTTREGAAAVAGMESFAGGGSTRGHGPPAIAGRGRSPWLPKGGLLLLLLRCCTSVSVAPATNSSSANDTLPLVANGLVLINTPGLGSCLQRCCCRRRVARVAVAGSGSGSGSCVLLVLLLPLLVCCSGLQKRHLLLLPLQCAFLLLLLLLSL